MTAPKARAQRARLRKDAERNRTRLLDAARQAFADQGLEAPFEEIARRAGVGIGTLYRRFPTRAALIEALFEDKAAEYVRASEAALAADDDWDGFAGFVERICEMQAKDRGFTDVLTATFPAAPGVEACRAEARANAEKLIGRRSCLGLLSASQVQHQPRAREQQEGASAGGQGQQLLQRHACDVGDHPSLPYASW